MSPFLDLQFVWLTLALLFALFSVKFMRPPLAVALSLLVGFLCVPPHVASWNPPYTYLFNRMNVAPIGLLIGFSLYRRELLRRWPFSWIDLPMIVFVLLPLISLAGHQFENLANGLTKAGWSIGFYGLGYTVARITYRTKDDLQTLFKTYLMFGLIYALPGLYESFVGPENYIKVQLLGSSPPNNAHRLGGYRPSVFQDGLTYGFLYACMTFSSLWMLMHAKAYQLERRRGTAAAIFLLGCQIWFRGLSAYLSTAIGLVCLAASRKKAIVVTVLTFALLATSYIGLRSSGKLTSDTLTTFVAEILPNKTSSLSARLKQEERVIGEIHRDHTWLGLGPTELWYWTDGAWVSTLEEFGYIGLAAWWIGMVLLPIFVASHYTWVSKEGDGDWVLPMGLAIMIVMYGCDSLANHPFLPQQYLFPAAILSFCLNKQNSLTQSKD